MDFDPLTKADDRLEINDDSVVILAGPTGSGKSALAIEWARRHHGTIINADSMQIYQDLQIVTARPSKEDTAIVPHALYGFVPHDQMASAAWWRDQALMAIADVRAQGRVPIVTGGTGFYLDALIHGFSPMPDVADAIRQQAEGIIAEYGSQGLHSMLQEVDPVMAARLKPGDRQRVARAWSVWQATGQSLAVWQSLPRQGPPAGMVFSVQVLMPPREWLYPRLNQRFAAMVATGAIDEVAALLVKDPARQSPLFKAVGVPQIADYLAQKIDFDTMVDHASRATRHYAKRQMTWFRHQLPVRA